MAFLALACWVLVRPENKHMLLSRCDRIRKLSNHILRLKPDRPVPDRTEPSFSKILLNSLSCASEAISVYESCVKKDPEDRGKSPCSVEVLRVAIRPMRSEISDQWDL